MNWRARLDEEVRDELSEIATWYENHQPDLGAQFLAAAFSALDEIAENPRHSTPFQPRSGAGIRRKLLRRFPHAIFFRIEETEVFVFHVKHCARDPRRLAPIFRQRLK